MVEILWDTSALIKHYVPERGNAMADRLFERIEVGQMCGVALTMGELVSVVVRQRNAGRLTAREAAATLIELDQGLLNHPEFRWIDRGAEDIRRSLSLISRHTINATDALVLRSALDADAVFRQAGDTLVLVASDARLVRAARAEGLTVFNPETDTEAQLDALLAA